jgi:uncharacterized membrane protein (UPF0127 family)
MKDMKFPIDMIWFDEKKQVVHVEESAQPDSYPESFCPPVDAKYILEVPAGSARAWSLASGDQAVL